VFPDCAKINAMESSDDYLRKHTVGDLRPRSGPIEILDYNPKWPDRFEVEASNIRSALGGSALQVEHVGSTSVLGLIAKPIIDIVLVVVDSTQENQYATALEAAGYKLRVREPGWHEHRMFTSLTEDINVHVFSRGCPEVDRMLQFRDWLRTSEADRELYAQTKRALARQQWKYTQNYADAKTAVVEEIMSRARRAPKT
jgi:GrpB-like predicted nucleotidyltransferase (UPF0157 family)